jgi:hypothetical protein
MTIPQALLTPSATTLSSIDREKIERDRADLETYRSELLLQLDTNEFRAKNMNDQKAELDLMIRLFKDQVNRRMNLRMQSEFKSGGT